MKKIQLDELSNVVEMNMVVSRNYRRNLPDGDF